MTGVWPQPPGEAFQGQSWKPPRQRGCSKNCKYPRETGSQDPLKMQEQQRVLAVGCGRNPS